MRVFIAIELDEDLKEYVFKQQGFVKINSVKGNFSRKENFHLTLRFIGEADHREIEVLKGVIDKTGNDFHPFNLKLGELGCFSKKNKKIIWLGISKGQKELQRMFNFMENNLVRQGFERELRGLKPHITLAREVVLKTDFSLISQEMNILNKEIPVKKISLMESTRVNGKLTYRPIYIKNINIC
jgi:2'-5' RNA ligase